MDLKTFIFDQNVTPVIICNLLHIVVVCVSLVLELEYINNNCHVTIVTIDVSDIQ